ncbi:MAG: tRNA-dihydrouridine synthase, partial [Syntrophothermus sp.]
GVDGLMAGRAAVGAPWLFREIREYIGSGNILSPPSLLERLTVIRQHLQNSITYKGERCSILEMRKFYSGYFRGLPDNKIWRMKLIKAENMEEVEEILQQMEKEVVQ